MPSLATMPTRSRSLAGQPLSPTPLQAPAPPPASPGFQFAPPSIGAAPTPTATPAFQAPSLPGGMDPYQWRVDQANKGAQRSAAARGTLLSGGFQQELAKLNQGLASEEADNIFNRAATTHGINLNTNAQNYGQSLAGYNAGTGATLDAGRLGLAGAQAAYGAQRDAYGDARSAAADQTNVANANAQGQDEFAALMEQYRAQQQAEREAEVARQNEAVSAMQRRPMGRSLGFSFSPRPELR